MTGHHATVIIPWKNRPELEVSLCQNAFVFKKWITSVAIVNCGGDKDHLLEMVSRTGLAIDLIDMPGARFNRSLALNVGSHYAASDLLVLLDADIIPDGESLQECLNSVRGENVITIDRLIESSDDYGRSYISRGYVKEIVSSQLTELIWADGRTTSVTNYRSYLGSGYRGGQGQLIVKKCDFLAIGGYDSALVGWGFEDIDILIRLQRVLGLCHKQIGVATHLSHGDEVRNLEKGSRTANNIRNADFSYLKYTRGEFIGSMSRDVSDWRAIVNIYRVAGDTITPLQGK